MRRRRQNGEIFSVSFLDVICCGFGAMVLLVLMSKTDIIGGAASPDESKAVLAEVLAARKANAAAIAKRTQLAAATEKLAAKIADMNVPNTELSNLKKQLANQQAKVKALQAEVNTSPPLPQNDTPTALATNKVVKVAGIPVDSNYIIFIVDTSGSMQSQWSRVIRELENVLDIHPQVTGFQIMNDNGIYLLKAYAGKWIPDTPGRRKSVLSLMKDWGSLSNSSPVEGLQLALRTYAKRTENLAIYIFGDEYTGSSYDPVLTTVSTLNRDRSTQRPIARIHGIGFYQYNSLTTSRFATLMREVARRNRGTFIALGR